MSAFLNVIEWSVCHHGTVYLFPFTEGLLLQIKSNFGKVIMTLLPILVFKDFFQATRYCELAARYLKANLAPLFLIQYSDCSIT